MNAAAIDYTFAEWVCALYLPLMAALLLALTTRRRPRRFAACLLGLLWTLPALLVLQRLNQAERWWTFPGAQFPFRGIPLALYAGWAILWGILPTLALPRLRLIWVTAVMASFDVFAMPLCDRIVRLSPIWLIGEVVAIVVVLIPGLCLARATERQTHLPLRATLQVATAGLLFLFFVPELIFAMRPGYGWAPLLDMFSWQLQLALLCLVILALPGVGAVMEFAQRGQGTPIPYDPPKRLVVSGIYRYVANPMQLSCMLVILLWAAILRNPWLMLAAAITVLYSAGIARWDERQDLALRFGSGWREYRLHVRDWLPRWLPFFAGNSARLYLATSCKPCSELRNWLEARSPIALTILPAESLQCPSQISIFRITYDPNDGSPAINGIRAMGRALEHLNLTWTLAGSALRLPGVWQLLQLVMDVGGFGPRPISGARTTGPDPLLTRTRITTDVN